MVKKQQVKSTCRSRYIIIIFILGMVTIAIMTKMHLLETSSLFRRKTIIVHKVQSNNRKKPDSNTSTSTLSSSTSRRPARPSIIPAKLKAELAQERANVLNELVKKENQITVNKADVEKEKKLIRAEMNEKNNLLRSKLIEGNSKLEQVKNANEQSDKKMKVVEERINDKNCDKVGKVKHSHNRLRSNMKCRPSVLCISNKRNSSEKILFWNAKNNSNILDFNSTQYNLVETNNNPYYQHISIKTKNEWEPGCQNQCPYFKCSKSSKRKELDFVLTLLLKEWSKISGASELDIMTINTFGSLIASTYRNNIVMPWDTDLDFLIWAHDMIKVENFMDEYNARKHNTFRLVIQPDWRCKHLEIPGDWGGRHYYDPNGKMSKTPFGNSRQNLLSVPFVAPNIRLIHKDSKFYMDMWGMYSGLASAKVSPMEGGKATYQSSKYVNFIDKNYGYINVLRNEIFPLKRCLLNGIQIWCPNKPKPILKKVFHTDPVENDHVLNRRNGCWEPRGERWLKWRM